MNDPFPEDEIRERALDLFADLRGLNLDPRDRLQDAVQRMAEIKFELDSTDGTVQVHMAATGALNGVQFRNRAFTRHDEASLSRAVEETIRAAEAVVKTAAGYVREGFNGRESS